MQPIALRHTHVHGEHAGDCCFATILVPLRPMQLGVNIKILIIRVIGYILVPPEKASTYSTKYPEINNKMRGK